MSAARRIIESWTQDHDAAHYAHSSKMPHCSARLNGGHYDDRERDVERPHHHQAGATYSNNSSEYVYNAPLERYDQGAPALSRELGLQERMREYEPNKTSLGFIMNCTTTTSAPAPLHQRRAHSRPPPRETSRDAMPHEPGPSSIFIPSDELSTSRPARSTRRSTHVDPVYRAPDRSTGMSQQLLLPPLEARRRMVSTRSVTAAESVEMLVHLAQTDRAPMKTAKKRKATTMTTTAKSKTMSYEEKRRSRECKIDGCENYIINKGLCFRHGGGKKCSEKGCTSSAKNAGKCWKHGGSVKCLVEGCERRGKSRGFCWAHGGGTECSDASCSKVAVSNGYCWAHGGGKRCAYEGCKKAAYERTFNYCFKHHEQLKDGGETLEV